MKILCIDSVSRVMRVELFNGEKWIERVSEMSPESKHDKRVVSLVDAVLREGELTLGEVDTFAVCVGPGGFTGPRVGVAAVLGFCLVHPKPIVALGEYSRDEILRKVGAGEFTKIEELEPHYNGEYVVNFNLVRESGGHR